MATLLDHVPISDEENVFKKVRRQIEEIFDSLIESVNERREVLLRQLNQWEEEFNRTRASCIRSLEEIKRERAEMEGLLAKLKINQSITNLEKGIMDLTNATVDVEKDIHFPQVIFVCNTDYFDLEISKFGSLINETEGDMPFRKHSHLSKPVKLFGKFGKGKGEFYYPSGILIDDNNHRLLIGDSFNSRIQVWSKEGDYMSEFGEGTLQYPWGMVLRHRFIYITDYTGCFLSKWHINSFTLAKKSNTLRGSKTGQLKHPSGLDVDKGEVFVVESGNNRISVFDLNLEFRRVMADKEIDNSNSLRVRDNTIYIAEMSGNIKLFSKSDQLLKTIPKLTTLSKEICNFTFDSQMNFIVTVSDKNSLFILSPKGEEIIHSLSFTELSLNHPIGIDISKDGRIAISFESGSNAIVVF